MPGPHYLVPPTVDLSTVVNLMPEHTHRAAMLPTTPVICVNRGPRTLDDKYDGDDYVIPPYVQFQVSFAAALHFQRRQIVPGTRNPDVQAAGVQYVSWIGILGIDPDEACAVFTDEELALFGESAEGLNRALLPTAADREATAHQTKTLGRQLPGMGLTPSAQAMSTGMASGALHQDIIGGSPENRDALLAKVEGSDAVTEDQAGRTGGFVKPTEAALRVQSDAAPRQRDLAAPPAPPIGRRRGGPQ